VRGESNYGIGRWACCRSDGAGTAAGSSILTLAGCIFNKGRSIAESAIVPLAVVSAGQSLPTRHPTTDETWANVRCFVQRQLSPLVRKREDGAMLKISHPCPPPKIRATFYVAPDVLDEARDATVYLAGYPVRLTLTQLVENALRAELKRLRDQHHAGQQFPKRAAELKGGRPIAA